MQLWSLLNKVKVYVSRAPGLHQPSCCHCQWVRQRCNCGVIKSKETVWCYVKHPQEKMLCLSSFSVSGRFQILQNGSSLSSAQITLMRKLALDTKEWILSQTTGDILTVVCFYYSGWLELFLSCNNDNWCFVQLSSAVVPKAQNRIFSFILDLIWCFFVSLFF